LRIVTVSKTCVEDVDWVVTPGVKNDEVVLPLSMIRSPLVAAAAFR